MARQPRRLYSAWERSAAVVAGHLTNAPLAGRPALLQVRHFDPTWHRVSVTPGQANHSLQRSFQLLSQFQTAARDARLHRANADLQRLRDFLIGESFDVSKNHGLAIRAAQATESFT